MRQYIGVIYLVLALFILLFGIANFIKGAGQAWQNILIVLIGLYFAYRGVASIHNAAVLKERENRGAEDQDNDPANA